MGAALRVVESGASGPDHFAPAITLALQMAAHLKGAARVGFTMSEAERWLKKEGQEFLRRMLQGAVDELGPGAVEGGAVVGEDRVVRTHREAGERTVMSHFGELKVGRVLYGARHADSRAPLDAALNLPPEKFTLEVQRAVAIESAKRPFDDVVATLEEYTGAHVPKRQAELLAQRAAMDFEAFYALRKVHGVRSIHVAGRLLVMSTDAKGIRMCREDLREETQKLNAQRENKMVHRRSAGEKSALKRMAQVACVYAMDPYVRTAEQVMGELAGDQEAAAAPARPRPQHKRVFASVVQDSLATINSMFQEADARDPTRQMTWVVLVDGGPTQLARVRKCARKYKAKVTIIVDVIHVLEYVWKAAGELGGSSHADREAWVTKRLREVLGGKAKNVARNIRAKATRMGLGEARRKATEKCAGYLAKYSPYLHYDRYLAKGLPIATGVIEGACRHLIEDRLGIAGARWRLGRAEAVLRLRALHSSGDFEAYWRFHERKEHQRNHATRYAEKQAPPLVGKAGRAKGNLKVVR